MKPKMPEKLPRSSRLNQARLFDHAGAPQAGVAVDHPQGREGEGNWTYRRKPMTRFTMIGRWRRSASCPSADAVVKGVDELPRAVAKENQPAKSAICFGSQGIRAHSGRRAEIEADM
jgi:hypothetical protein